MNELSQISEAKGSDSVAFLEEFGSQIYFEILYRLCLKVGTAEVSSYEFDSVVAASTNLGGHLPSL